METINLSPLKQLTKLVSLEISYNALKEIDLSALEYCTSLRSLIIDYNGGLKEIDLQPLKNCINLTHLSITNSNIHKLDLEPISNCKKLRNLELRKNSLEELILCSFPIINYLLLGWNILPYIDLTPLERSPHLHFLELRNNLLFQIDLTPLKFCPELKAIWLEKTHLKSIEISPLFHYYSIEGFYIDDDVRLIADPGFQKKTLPKGFLKHKDRINWITHPSEIESQESLLNEFQKDIENLESTSALSSEIFQKGIDMIGSYLYLYCLENYLRAFIEKVFIQKYGENYTADTKMNSQIRKKTGERRKEELNNQWLPLRGDSDFYYMDFKELGLILQNNWGLFSSYFPDQGWIVSKINELARIRNLIAHNSYIEQEQRTLIKIYYNFILKQISERTIE